MGKNKFPSIIIVVMLVFLAAFTAILLLRENSYVLVIDQRNVSASTAQHLVRVLYDKYQVRKVYWVVRPGETSSQEIEDQDVVPDGAIYWTYWIDEAFFMADRDLKRFGGGKHLLLAAETEIAEFTGDSLFSKTIVILVDSLGQEVKRTNWYIITNPHS
ncbi:MAG: hypothetical protein Q8P77_00500 [Candidatus Veblenbacteria bacterium]|nr:hypothetical protein [Candidatus Veblenbacteria bacterium]